jgi:hypothetical protein
MDQTEVTVTPVVWGDKIHTFWGVEEYNFLAWGPDARQWPESNYTMAIAK